MLQVKIMVFLGYSIFKLVYFFKTTSICLNLDHFGAGKNTGCRPQVTGHCLPIQEEP